MPSQILLFDQSRSASHLLARMLSKQSRLELLSNPYSGCRGKQVEWLTSDDWEQGMSDAAYSESQASAKKATALWQEALVQSQRRDKILLVHDHPFSSARPDHVQDLIKSSKTGPVNMPSLGNFTSIPDELLLHPDTIPVLTIRDPRLAVPSAYRVLTSFGFAHASGRPNFLVSTSLLWQRNLYDFFTSHDVQPLIIDADDMMTDPFFPALVCEKLGLDPDQACSRWERITEEEKAELHPMVYASQKHLLESEGVDASRAATNTDFDVEEEGWDAEFGEDTGMAREMVDLGMEHYLYLRERRLNM